MKIEEVLAMEAVLRYSDENGIGIVKCDEEPEGRSTCPDFGLRVSEKKYVALEVVNGGKGFIFHAGELVERSEVEQPTLICARGLKKSIGKWIAPGETIILWIDQIITDARGKFFRYLEQELKMMYKENRMTDTLQEITINSPGFGSGRVSASITDYYSDKLNYVPIVTSVGLGLSSDCLAVQSNLSFQARAIIQDRVSLKEMKCEGLVNFEGKWLAIINNLPDFCSPEMYRNELNYLMAQGLLEHSFEKIFIIHEGKAIQIFERK